MNSHISVFFIIHTPPAAAALMLFPSETASLSQPGSSSGGLAEDSRTAGADNNGLGVTKNCCDSVTAWAFDIHEVAVRMLHKSLQLVLPLLFCWKRMKQIFSQRHFVFSLVEVNQAILASTLLTMSLNFFFSSSDCIRRDA